MILGNLMVRKSGGPTSVSNASLVGYTKIHQFFSTYTHGCK